MRYAEELDYEIEMGKRLAQLDASQENEIEAERAVLFRQRIEGVSVWWHGGGHVLYPLNFIITRKAFEAMLQAQDEKTRNAVNEALNHCLKNDPFQLDANYPLLEYYLRAATRICDEEKPFRPLAIPVELCDWIQSIKPEEYLHYAPADWCYECGYRYPAQIYSIGHDARTFLLTRYSPDEIEAMGRPFRGKACFVCGGEIVNYWGMSESGQRRRDVVKVWQGSPAQQLCDAKRAEWNAEIEAVTGGIADLKYEFTLFDPDKFKDVEEAAEADFRQRRGKRPGVRVEHRPSVQSILDLWARHG